MDFSELSYKKKYIIFIYFYIHKEIKENVFLFMVYYYRFLSSIDWKLQNFKNLNKGLVHVQELN